MNPEKPVLNTVATQLPKKFCVLMKPLAFSKTIKYCFKKNKD